jgi:NTE family protein
MIVTRRMGYAIAGGIVLAIILAITITGCSYPVRNFELKAISGSAGYRWANLPPDDMPDTLVIVSASGGGTRAATLELGVLRALDHTLLPSGKRLSEEVDMISSVSGGSVTAAYFALHGRAALQTSWPDTNPLPYDLENRFIRRSGTRALIFDVLNPLEWVRLSTPSRERIDPLIDYFDRTLFTKGETYDTLLKARRRPFLVLNAADMVEGIPFPFTQAMFDLLCSDLSRTKLSVGVATSAAFPLALSPVTLKNYSHCAAQDAVPDWPPAWVKTEAETDWQGTDTPEIVGRGRAEAAYAFGVPQKPQDSKSRSPFPDPRSGMIDQIGARPIKKAYIHLLDGGIADNLGVAEPYRTMTQQGMSAPFFNLIRNGTVKRILFVMVNSRSAASSRLDRRPDTPGIVDMLQGTTGASIDNASIGAAHRLRELLYHAFEEEAASLKAQGNDAVAANFQTVADNTSLVSVDFDAIPNATCRQRFHNIGTNWGMSDEEVTAVLDVGEAMTANDPQFRKAAAALGASIDPHLPTLGKACSEVPHNENQ